jgi:peptidoglycan LD-endopeptidase CwlK
MPSFGARSKTQLDTCHPYLRIVLEEAIKHRDFTIIQGWRSKEEQEECFSRGTTTVHWPRSKHNNLATNDDVAAGLTATAGAPLSLAADVAIWHKDTPHIRWKSTGEFYMLSGFLQGMGELLLPKGWHIRPGADWDRDGLTDDQSFHDLPHIELIKD